MKDPVDHILRPQLPWRTDPGITECGLNAEKAPTITRDQFFERRRDLGKQRAAMMTCMTCSGTADSWGTWDDDPRKALEREITWETARRRTDHGERLRNELLAIAALIEAHRDEFDALVDAEEQRRRWNEKKAANRAAKLNAAPTRRI